MGPSKFYPNKLMRPKLNPEKGRYPSFHVGITSTTESIDVYFYRSYKNILYTLAMGGILIYWITHQSFMQIMMPYVNGILAFARAAKP